MHIIKGFLSLTFTLIFLTTSAYTEFKDAYPKNYEPIDSLGKWYSTIIKKNSGLTSSEDNFSKEKIKSLYSELATELRMELNEDVFNYIHHYTTGQKSNFEIALSLGNLYNNQIIETISKNKVPKEIQYLPIVLSGMHNQAISPEGGVGIWKLNYFVAIKYGLQINKYIDERKDPTKSTEVAVKYLKDLYNEYKSWNMAITAFAFSPAIVNKAMIKSEGAINYWEIKHNLTAQEQQIIPSFFAAIYVSNFHLEHDMLPPHIVANNEIEPIKLEEVISVKLLSEKMKVSEQQLQILNPTHRGNLIYPEKISGNSYYVPQGVNSKIEAIAESLIVESKKYNEPEKLAKKVYVPHEVVTPPNSTKIVYTVKSGDFLGKIAEKHNVGVSSIKRWNNLRSDRIDIGQKLEIYVGKAALTTTQSKAKPATESKPTLYVSPSLTTEYTIKEGDTLWKISKENPGNSIEKIQKLNGISDSIKPGQVIKILKP